MEKMKWTRPEVTGEMFEANEYVAACITGTIQCMYPGNGSSNGKAEYDDYNGQQSGWYTDHFGKQHGLCGNDAIISFNGDTGSGYESSNGQIQRNRPIYNIKGYESKVGVYYNVTWNSKDGDNNSGEYSHIGRLNITNIDNAHPNHS